MEVKIDPTHERILDRSRLNQAQRLYRLKWNEYPKLGTVSDWPINLDLELSARCNLRCIMCMREFMPEDEKKGMMPETLFQRCIDEGVQYKDFHAIKLNYRGESTLNHQIVNCIQYAKDRGVLDVMLNTNGNFSPDLVERLLEAGLDELAFSVDAHTKETYGKIRRGGDFDKVVRNIERAIELKKEMKSECRIRVSYVLQKDNHQEFLAFRKHWEERGIDKITANFCYRPGDVGEDRSIDGAERITDFVCAQLWQRLVVLWDGRVVACCGDFKVATPLGDAWQTSIYDIWHGPILTRLRNAHASGQSTTIPMCRTCGLATRSK